MSLDSIRALLHSCDTAVIAGGLAQPQGLLQALQPIDTDLTVIDLAVPGLGTASTVFFSDRARFQNAFMLAPYRRLAAAGRMAFTPMHHSARLRHLCEHTAIDALLLRVSAADSEGYCSLGPHTDFIPDLLPRAGKIVAEVNANMPATANGPRIKLDSIDALWGSSQPLPQIPAGAPGAVAAQIAAQVVAHIDDGDCLQLGLGSVPAAVLPALSNHRHLGLHTGMLTAAARPLIEDGVFTHARKTVDRSLAVTGYLAGDSAFYQWAGSRADIGFRPVSYTHSAQVIARIDHFVAINTALEVDLLGQINSEHIDGRQVSGSGGLVDFVRGSALSRGGRNIIALQATAAGGSRSRIVPQLGSCATLLRNDIDILATEFGSARLAGLDLDARAEAITALAHPAFRPQLQRRWEQMRKQLLGFDDQQGQ